MYSEILSSLYKKKATDKKRKPALICEFSNITKTQSIKLTWTSKYEYLENEI